MTSRPRLRGASSVDGASVWDGLVTVLAGSFGLPRRRFGLYAVEATPMPLTALTRLDLDCGGLW